MKEKKGQALMRLAVMFLLVLIAVTGTAGFAQSGSPGSPPANSTGTNAAAQANANVVYAPINNTDIPRQFVGAFPGVANMPGPMPGIPVQNGEWHIYWPPMFREITPDMLDSARRRWKLTDIFHGSALSVVSFMHGILPQQPGSVRLVKYDPNVIAYPADRPIIKVTVIGDWRNPEPYLFAAINELRDRKHVNRVAILERALSVNKTTAHSFGLGGSFAKFFSPDNNAGGMAIGFEGGSSQTQLFDPHEFIVIGLNDGPVDPPQLPEPPKEKAAASGSAPAPAQSPLPQVASTLPVQTIRIEVVQAPPTLASVPSPQPRREEPPSQPTQQQPEASMVPQASRASSVSCQLPELTVYFRFNDAEVLPVYRPSVAKMAAWAVSHPACELEIEGHADRWGSNNYNDTLGERRSQAVLRLLEQYSSGLTRANNRVRAASFGKYYPQGENDARNRRVVLHVVGSRSGR